MLYGTFARFASWLPTEEALAAFLGYIDEAWGSGGSLAPVCTLAPARPDFSSLVGPIRTTGREPGRRRPHAHEQPDRHQRHPLHDSRSDLGDPPNWRCHDRRGGRTFLAERIPDARYVELPDTDHIPFVGDNATEIADLIGEFLTGSRAPIATDTVLATVLFTDIVGSTEKAASLGDRRWGDLLDSHHSIVRRNLERFRGRELRTAGDGFFAHSTVPRGRPLRPPR